ncbi:MAG: DUF4065 domain-containing protein [Acidimicrobiia bacterium]|nr:DUF4065 domain-containing protein [Acidimicrobiia bacterium]MYC58006.1 DUF4065 domain-containing protein [Acidimicrobiia bacterium]MYI31045.1 DUF4065 domain-containing protein [Acidimicrobiia bacterium]
MSFIETNENRAASCYEALLVLAAKRGLHVTRTKIVKLLYLADLRSVEHSGASGSGVAWRWRDYGPFDNRLLAVEDRLVKDDVVKRDTIWWDSGDGKRHDLSALCQSSTLLDESDSFVEHIEAVLDEYGAWSANRLKRYAYQTPPMQEAQESGDYDGLLDLDETVQVSDMRDAVSSYQGVVDRLAPDDDDPPISDDLSFLVEEVREWSELRKRATSKIV